MMRLEGPMIEISIYWTIYWPDDRYMRADDRYMRADDRYMRADDRYMRADDR
ncbi:hypothetical protein [Peribacillus tepidiphilus]|uniref:hypothetical protein n=1 Tax=Peribacillus tepidiphilus TaxID=2652445 RepID=UPI0035B50E05